MNCESPIRWRLLLVLSLVLGGLFLVNEQDFRLLSGDGRSITELRESQYLSDVDETEELIETGSNVRRVAFPLLGLLGLAFMLAGRRPCDVHAPLVILVMLFYCWCVASIAWSDVPSLTAKRLVVLTLGLIVVAGISRLISLPELAAMTLMVSSGFVLFGLAIEMRSGVFEPWRGAYRFAGLVHPNTQGGYCATMLISAFSLQMLRTGRRSLLLSLWMAAALALLLLTKSRSTLAGAVLACSAAWMLISPAHKRALAITLAPLLLAIGAAVLVVLGLASGDNVRDAVSLGRDEQIGGLNGRVPLWTYLVEPISNRPLLGYGFDSYWTPDRISRTSSDLDWTIPNSHNGLVEVQLNLGAVGALLFAAIGLTCVGRCVGRMSRLRDPRLVLPVSLGIFALFASVFEASFTQPTGMDAMLSCCALTMGAILPDRDLPSTPSTPATPDRVGRATAHRRGLASAVRTSQPKS